MASSSDLVRAVESVLGVSLGDSVSDSVVVVVTTSVAVVIGLLVVLVWKRSSNRGRDAKPLVVPKLVVKAEEEEEGGGREGADVASGKTKVTILFGTQTGTAEGFAKVMF